MKIRRFNDKGLAEFKRYVDFGARTEESPPFGLLENSVYTEEFLDVELPNKTYSSKYELGYDLNSALDQRSMKKLGRDPKAWAWLALYFARSTIPLNNGTYFIGARNRHLLGNFDRWASYNHDHRHLVMAAVTGVRRFGEHAKVLFAGADGQSKVEEQIMSRKVNMTFAHMETLVEALYTLYWDKSSSKVKRGAKSGGGGGVVRVIELLKQFDATFDIASMTAEEIIGLLPRKEFSKFIS